MKKAIRLDEPKEEKQPKPIELKYSFTDSMKIDNSVIEENEVIYHLGKCKEEGDFFMGKCDNLIHIYKGHLNDGVY